MKKPSNFSLRTMLRSDWNETAKLIHASLNVWYKKNRGFELVPGPWKTMLVFPQVYEALDPGCCVLAVDDESGRIAGSCFYHPRPTHTALGIMNVHPNFFGHGVGPLLLRHVIAFARSRNLPLRLVSSLMNLDSFSLYNKAGFKPGQIFQDMILEVPETGIPYNIPQGSTLRDMVADDIPAVVALERELCGIDREQDFRFFVENQDRIWGASVLFGPNGKLEGFLVSVNDPGSNMLGPGLARSESAGQLLILRELNRHRGRKPVWLVPADRSELLAVMYGIGAKNCEIHVAQILDGTPQPSAGIVFPTFMPETS